MVVELDIRVHILDKFENYYDNNLEKHSISTKLSLNMWLETLEIITKKKKQSKIL